MFGYASQLVFVSLNLSVQLCPLRLCFKFGEVWINNCRLSVGSAATYLEDQRPLICGSACRLSGLTGNKTQASQLELWLSSAKTDLVAETFKKHLLDSLTQKVFSNSRFLLLDHSNINTDNRDRLSKNKANCAVSSRFAITYYTNVGLGLAGWLSPGLRPGEASHYLVVSI